jgi:hypothetical protein
LLTPFDCLVEAKKTEENGANGHDETTQEAERPNAFDRIKADENDEGKTGAKVRIHDMNRYGSSIANMPRSRLRSTTAISQRTRTQPTNPMAPPNPTPLQEMPSKKTPPAKKPNPPTSSKKA